MSTQPTIDLARLSQVLWRRRYFIVVCGAAFALTALIVNLLSPKLYQSQSLVALPEVVRYTRNNDVSKSITTIVNTAEARALLPPEVFGAIGPDAALNRTLVGIALADVRGSSAYFKMTVTARGDPAAAVALSRLVLAYLQGRPVVSDKLDAERRSIEDYLRLTDEAIARVARQSTRARPANGATTLEAELNRLRETSYQLRTMLGQTHNFQFIIEPSPSPAPIGPRVPATTILFAVIGLILSAAATLVMDPQIRSALYYGLLG